MWTIKHKGFYIFGEFGKDACRIHAGYVREDQYVWEVKSLRAAKLRITRMIKEGTTPPDY